MSVATQHSPFAVGSKRLFESEENEDRLQRLDSSAATHKRYRARHGSPADGRCDPQAHLHAAYAVGQATATALRGLFPEMSDKVIADVLAEYGDNIDAAIKRLTDLRLSAGASGSAAAEQQAQDAEQQAQVAEQQVAAAQQEAAAQQQQAAVQGGTTAAAAPGAARSAEQWIDVVVSEMAAAADMADARSRASKVLQAFEQAAVAHAKSAEQERVRGQLADALRENQLLKRAVAIQNTRLQELGGKEAEAAQLRGVVEPLQQRVHALEVQNYSLALHLKQATDGKDAMSPGGGFRKNPDVY